MSITFYQNVDCEPGEFWGMSPYAITPTTPYCQSCPKGSYSETGNVTTCTECPLGYTTLQTGSTSSSQCEPSMKLNIILISPLEFSLDIFTEFTEKIFVIKNG